MRIYISIDEFHCTRKKRYEPRRFIRKILVLVKFFNTTYVRANAVNVVKM